jgi:hypothetical protein
LPRMREARSLQPAGLPKVRRSSASSQAAKPHIDNNHGGVWLCRRTIWISVWRKHPHRYSGRLRLRDGRHAGRSAYWLCDQSDSSLTPISPWAGRTSTLALAAGLAHEPRFQIGQTHTIQPSDRLLAEDVGGRGFFGPALFHSCKKMVPNAIIVAMPAATTKSRGRLLV